MLPLIPALLLLAFHGPSGLEKLSHEGRLPKAFRVLERVWAPSIAAADSEAPTELRDDRKRALQSLAAIAADPDFSRAVWSLFELTFDAAEPGRAVHIESDFEHEPGPTKIGHRPDDSLRDGFWQSRRTRAGPAA